MVLIRNLNVSGGRDPWGRDNYFYFESTLCLERTGYFKGGLKSREIQVISPAVI